MKSSDIIVDVKTLGQVPYLACGCEPVYEFDQSTNRKTDNLIGYKVIIALPHLQLAKVGIKLNTTRNPLPEFVDGELLDVDFKGLTLGVYTDRAGKLQLYGKADSVELANKTNLKLNAKSE